MTSSSVGIVVPTLGEREDYLRLSLKSIREAGSAYISVVAPESFRTNQVLIDFSVDQFVVDAEEENITRERIEASRKPTMSEEDLRKKAVVEAARANEKAAAESLIKNKDKAANSKVEQEKIAENELELDGESEDPTGDVSVSYQSSTKKYLVAISSNLGEEDLVLRATKKGAKTLQYKVTTNAEGNVKFSTKNVLKGFTMTLLFNGERLDSVKVK